MTRTSWERIDLLHRFFATGIKALVFGFVFWFLLLAVSASAFLFEDTARFDHHVYGMFRWFRSGWGVGVIYGSTFFLSSMLAARSRWSFCPALAAFLAYAVFVVICLPDPMPSKADYWCFFSPLLTAPTGGWLGERLFRRLQR